MNAKAEKFQEFLKAREVPADTFYMAEQDDEMKTVLFRSHIEIHGNRLPIALVFDTSVYGMLRILVAPSVRTDENEAAILKLIDEYNRKYKVIKYYIDERGGLVLDICMLETEARETGDIAYAMIDVAIQHLGEEYRNIMKAIWG